MREVTERPDLINGQLKFDDDTVKREELIALAKEIKDGEEGEKIEFLAIRGCGKRETAIVFAYRSDGESKSYDKFVYKVTDQMKRRFGNSLRGWDISRGCTLIK